jgi:subtilisin-like proprotein convertase family protein
MKKLLLFLCLLCGISFGQNKSWSSVTFTKNIKQNKHVNRQDFPENYVLFRANISDIFGQLQVAGDFLNPNANFAIIDLPLSDGRIEKFKMYEASNFAPELQAQFPEIRAYKGIGIDNPTSQVSLSISPYGIETMIFHAGKATDYMETFSEDKTIFAVYARDAKRTKRPFSCGTSEDALASHLDKTFGNNVIQSSDLVLRTFDLAMSVTGEYSAFHGGTLASVNAAINTTMTRVNGVYMKDVAIRMVIVANNNNVIFLDAGSDPYGNTDANYNSELQTTLTSIITEANYDVGHLMSAIGNNGNAGCIGCVCVNGSKGSGFTTSTNPVGDTFDIDFVVHEFGHQFGGNHTFSHGGENNSVNYEPGSGVTIMGYAGITAYDVAPNSIDTFHAGSIAQIQANMSGKTCEVETAITHGAPVVNAGADFTIPLSTPFTLSGSATDTGGVANMTYQWEQYDEAASAQLGANSPASPTKTLGPNFRSYLPTALGVRTFPNWTSVLALSPTTAGTEITVEALSSVARSLNFRLTARDNALNGAQTNFDNTVITVANKTALTVTVPANTSYPVGSTQTVTWTGATGANGHQTISGASNVDILFSSDNGVSWTTLATNTPNDGSHNITLPAGVAAPFCRFQVKASANIFFNVSPAFAVGYTITNNCITGNNNTILNVPDANTTGVTKTINIANSVTISDVNVSIGLTHEYMSDLEISLIHPDGTTVIFYNRICGNLSGTAALTFSDGAPAVPTNCDGESGTFSPSQALSAFNGKPSNGIWTLRARDLGNADIGSVDNWTLEICSQNITLPSESFEIENFTIIPNPNNGNFVVKFTPQNDNATLKVFDISGRLVLEKNYENITMFEENISLNNVQSGVYLVSVENGNKKSTQKVIVE